MDNIIHTQVRRNEPSFMAKRKQLINEAVALECGTQQEPIKHGISNFGLNSKASLSKPGKEAARKKPNPFDMYPAVEIGDIDVTENWAFAQMWEYLIKISIIQHAAFKKALVLLYRVCYMVDHQEINGKLRYAPSPELLEYINNLQTFVLKDGFNEKFGESGIDLLHFLYFIDLLGWNEDVKYNTNENGEPVFGNDLKTGRVNTILSIISAPLLIGEFIQNIIDNAQNKNGRIDVHLITSTIQRFTISRGLCVLSNKELKTYLAPYLED